MKKKRQLKGMNECRREEKDKNNRNKIKEVRKKG
jgi:hypothetical protein